MAEGVLPFDARFRCTALAKLSGERCRRRAIPGGSVCKLHGGGAPAVRAAARRRLQRERLEGEVGKLLDELEATHAERHPVDALLDAVTRSSAMVEVLGSLVGQLSASPARLPSTEYGTAARKGALFGRDHLGDGRPHVLVVMYGEWLDRQSKASKLALEAGIDERRVRLAEQQGNVIIGVMRASFDDVLPVIRRTIRQLVQEAVVDLTQDEQHELAVSVEDAVKVAFPAIVAGHLRGVSAATASTAASAVSVIDVEST